MIETQEAVDNINDILDVDGLDGAFVGKQKIIILSCISMCDATFAYLYPINFKTSEPVSSPEKVYPRNLLLICSEYYHQNVRDKKKKIT